MPQRTAQQPLARLTAALLVAVILASGTLASAGRCQVGCSGVGEVAMTTYAAQAGDACCVGDDECAVPSRQPQPQDSHQPQKHGAECCPVSCTGCIARPMFVAARSIPALTEPALRSAAASPAIAVDALDVAFSIFHPPKA